ncbi:hypothetical protein [Christiangramia sp.]|uniref:hypothetical protein n=1 Tax=Christiangramia sp. TaxID=1931228 RepID=UPI002610818C|nr:hypothetical protein [Christiangramia sp.]
MDIIGWIKRLGKGKEKSSLKQLKDKSYSSENKFDSRELAREKFVRSKQKLFEVNRWSELPELSAKFQIYNSHGKKKEKLKVHDYIKIELPLPSPNNWVYVTAIKNEDDFAEFTVSPSKDPTDRGELKKEIKHFFIDEATSTFKVTLEENTIKGFEIGKNEAVNNKGGSAGKRKLINTLIAEGAWAGFQKLQWKKLTKYFVHKIEINNKL